MALRTPRRIAVLTSGGDAPGMNAAIRAVTRASAEDGVDVVGVRRGFRGLIDGDFAPLGRREVGGIMQHAGTVLGSSRCAEFMAEEGRRIALAALSARNVDALIVIGGNGSQAGALELHRLGLPVVGVASTIDNDLVGSDVTIGFDSAVGVAIEAIDRLRATASSHRRVLVVEVMGRDSGHIALHAGLAGGAEVLIVPEHRVDGGELLDAIGRAYGAKGHAIVVAAEGATPDAAALVGMIERAGDERCLAGINARATVLGYVQRGSQPTARDRLLASRLGAGAALAARDGRSGVLIGSIGGAVAATPLDEVAGRLKALDPALVELAGLLSR